MASPHKTREHILQTSLALFLAQGYNGTGMSQLVKNAGLSKGAFYHHYSSKNELYEEALGSFFSKFMEDQRYELIPTKSFREAVTEIYMVVPRLVERMVELTGNKELAPNYYKILVDFSVRNPDFNKTLKSYYQKTAEYLVRLITKAKENREIKFEPDAQVLANQIICLVEGVGLISSINHPNEIKVHYHKIFSQFFRLVEPS